jgi:hypothetical protein
MISPAHGHDGAAQRLRLLVSLAGRRARPLAGVNVSPRSGPAGWTLWCAFQTGPISHPRYVSGAPSMSCPHGRSRGRKARWWRSGSASRSSVPRSMARRAPWATAAASSSRPTTRTPSQRRCGASWADSAQTPAQAGRTHGSSPPAPRCASTPTATCAPAARLCHPETAATRRPARQQQLTREPEPTPKSAPRDACLRRPSDQRHRADIAAGIARCPLGEGAGRGG